MFWFFGQEACGILVAWPGMELHLESEVLITSLNHIEKVLW